MNKRIAFRHNNQDIDVQDNGRGWEVSVNGLLEAYLERDCLFWRDKQALRDRTREMVRALTLVAG